MPVCLTRICKEEIAKGEDWRNEGKGNKNGEISMEL